MMTTITPPSSPAKFSDEAKFSDDSAVCAALLHSREFIPIAVVADPNANADDIHDITLLSAIDKTLYVVERNSIAGEYGAYRFDSEDAARSYFQANRQVYESGSG